MKKIILLIVIGTIFILTNTSYASLPEITINDCAYSGGYEVSSYVASEIGSPEVHIFGVYETNSDHSFDYHPQGTADVYVERKGTPLIIVLSSYEPVLWRIHKEEGVSIDRIILNGLYEHQIEGAEGIPVVNRSGSGNYISACALAWPSSTGGCDTPGLVSGIEEITGTPITSFHGCYRATSFTIKDQSGWSDGTVTGNSVLNVDYEIGYVNAYDQSTVNLKPGGDIAYFYLYNQAKTVITGGEISWLLLHDESKAEIMSEADISWLFVADDSVVHIYGYDFSYSGGTLSGKWKNGHDFSFWALAGSPSDDPPPSPSDTMPTNIMLHNVNKLTVTVTTKEPTDITSSSVICGGNITADDGVSITARGICWGTSQNPTITDAHTSDGKGTGDFTTHITGLASDTTYYLRAYATDSAGDISYGDEKTFKTSVANAHSELEIAVSVLKILTGNNITYPEADLDKNTKIELNDAILALQTAAGLRDDIEWTIIGDLPEFTFSSKPVIDENTAFEMNVDPNDPW